MPKLLGVKRLGGLAMGAPCRDAGNTQLMAAKRPASPSGAQRPRSLRSGSAEARR